MSVSRPIAIVALALLCACAYEAPGPVEHTKQTAREGEALTRKHAEARAARVSNVRYDLELTLDPALEYFEGAIEIAFDLADANDDLTVDFVQGTVSDLMVNGESLPDAYNGFFLTLPAANLAVGSNRVTMRYTHPWSNDGSGLYRYDDPEDGNVYLYTDLEHYDAHRVMPLFDQPDIKGVWSLTIHAPESWQVISTRRETSVEAGPAESTKTWTFPPTPVMSSYLISVHAGPYAMWEDPDFRYPLRLFARQKLAQYMDAETWFEATRGSFDVLDAYYDLPYPYEKYDQIVVPDFNAGAMENIAAVTFNESFIERDGRDREEQLRLASVIAHEMAHMWFGDLVTMRWWNGLWLNESFASYMGSYAVGELGYEEVWPAFHLRGKIGAYRTDARVTTHAVETPVESTDDVYDNFDSISYSKGASTLRQASFLIGEDNFRDGIRIYLKRHAEGNTGLEDFIGALGEAAGRDLTGWAKEWLYTPGVNTIQADYSCSDGLIDAFALMQEAPKPYPVLRTQKVQIALMYQHDGAVRVDAVIPVTYSGGRTDVTEAIGKPCPTLVYPNHGDYGYVVVELDPRTRENLAGSISAIEDDFQRVMLWATLFEGARAGSIALPDYLDVVLAAAGQESDRTAVRKVYSDAATALEFLTVMGEPGAAALDQYASRVENMMWRRLEEAEAEQKTLFFDLYLESAHSDAGLARLEALLDDKVHVAGLVVDQDRRWDILRRMSGSGYGDVRQRTEAELKRDTSARARRQAIAIDAAFPDAANKAKYLDDLFDPASTTSLADQRAAARVLFGPGQEKLHEQYADRIIAQLASAEAEADPVYFVKVRLIAGTLTPATCTDASVARLAAMVDAHEKSRDSVRRAITETWEDDARCVARAGALK